MDATPPKEFFTRIANLYREATRTDEFPDGFGNCIGSVAPFLEKVWPSVVLAAELQATVTEQTILDLTYENAALNDRVKFLESVAQCTARTFDYPMACSALDPGEPYWWCEVCLALNA